MRDEDAIVCAWRISNPHLDIAPHRQGIEAQLTLDWPLLEMLAEQDGTTKEDNA
ncbi:hypothetical protein D9M69_648840 [compost metagenome]